MYSTLATLAFDVSHENEKPTLNDVISDLYRRVKDVETELREEAKQGNDDYLFEVFGFDDRVTEEGEGVPYWTVRDWTEVCEYGGDRIATFWTKAEAEECVERYRNHGRYFTAPSICSKPAILGITSSL